MSELKVDESSILCDDSQPRPDVVNAKPLGNSLQRYLDDALSKKKKSRKHSKD